MLSFLAGLVVGANVGVVLMAALVMAKAVDRELQ